MPEIRYCDVQIEPPVLQVQTVGTDPGPPGGDGWSLLSALNPDGMAGTSQYAIVITGTIGGVQLFGGGAPLRGLAQLVLGTAGGTLHPDFRVSIPLSLPLAGDEGTPFQFVVLVSSAFPDGLLGSSLNPDTTQLCLYGRVSLNGDPQTYGASFLVADLVWHWWDIGRIPAGHWAADQVLTTDILPVAPEASWRRMAPAPFGGNGETWLHFPNVWYQSLIAANACAFRFGVVWDGATPATFDTKIGNCDRANTGAGQSNRWGQSHFPQTGNLLEVPQVQQGGFFVHQNGNATTRPAYFGYAQLGRVFRYRTFAVRIDTLPDLLWRHEGWVSPGGVPIGQPWEETFLARERPRPVPGILTNPIVMVHQVGKFFGPPKSYGTWVTENGNGQSLSFGQQVFPKADQSRGEAVSAVSIGRRIFQRTSPAMQWRAHLVGKVGMPTAVQQVVDFTFVQFHPTRDPENLSDPPGTTPPPIVLVPAKQSLDVGALSAPPFAPSAATNERIQEERPSITGTTGYRRRWPLGTKAARVFTVSWPALSDADGEILVAWLILNPAWRYTPPRAAALPVLTISAAQLQQVGHRVVSCSVDVVVLTYTGV